MNPFIGTNGLIDKDVLLWLSVVIAGLTRNPFIQKSL